MDDRDIQYSKWMGLIGAIQIVFVASKLLGILQWDWIYILIPSMLIGVVIIVVAVAAFLVAAVIKPPQGPEHE